MNDYATLSPQMQEAVKFVEFWNMAQSRLEFIEAMEWPLETKSLEKASAMAKVFRDQGVNLKNLRETGKTEYDFAYLKLIGEKSMAALGRRKDEAEHVLHDITAINAEAMKILTELRKFKNKAVAYEAMLAEGE